MQKFQGSCLLHLAEIHFLANLMKSRSTARCVNHIQMLLLKQLVNFKICRTNGRFVNMLFSTRWFKSWLYIIMFRSMGFLHTARNQGIKQGRKLEARVRVYPESGRYTYSNTVTTLWEVYHYGQTCRKYTCTYNVLPIIMLLSIIRTCV